MRKEEKLKLANLLLQAQVFAALPNTSFDTFNRGYAHGLTEALVEVGGVDRKIAWQLAWIARAFLGHKCPGVAETGDCMSGCDCARHGLPTLKDLDPVRLVAIEHRLKGISLLSTMLEE